MKKAILAALTAFAFLGAGAAQAGWNSCVACHNGNVAPNKEKLLEKHKTAAGFIQSAKESKNPLMKSIQKDDQALRDAAKDIGLK